MAEAMASLAASVPVAGRVHLTELWRTFTEISQEKLPIGGPCTKLAKMRGALTAHALATLESLKRGREGGEGGEGGEGEEGKGKGDGGPSAEAFLDSLFSAIQTKWGVDLGY